MDCNNFFVSCERLFRPDLIGKPVIVLSSNDGCAVSRSQEVKDLGIPMGIPHFEIKAECKREKISVFSSNFALYRDISGRVMTALKAEFDQCSVYSIDEAFFEVRETMTESEMAEIRTRIIQKTGIPVSIGVAKTKTLAKVANRIAKKGTGVCIMDESLYRETLVDLPCGSVWGIGRQTTALLTKHNISTVSHLLAQDPTFIKKTLGIVGERLTMELQGVPVYSLTEAVDEEQGSYTSTRSFGSPVTQKEVLLNALSHHIAHVARKLRKDACVASRLTIITRGSRYGDFSQRKGVESCVLESPTNDTHILLKQVVTLLDSLYDPEVPYKKAGVVLSGILPEGIATGTLFGDDKIVKKTAVLNKVMDEITNKFGSTILKMGTEGGKQTWQENSAHISKRYTTHWNEIPLVKA